MTKITVRKTADGEYAGFTCQGHAGYDKKGQDVVCAALSILTINTLNSLEQLTHARMEVTSDEKTGVISCRFTDRLAEGERLLMDSYLMGCQQVFQNYGSKFVELEFKEV